MYSLPGLLRTKGVPFCTQGTQTGSGTTILIPAVVGQTIVVVNATITIIATVGSCSIGDTLSNKVLVCDGGLTNSQFRVRNVAGIRMGLGLRLQLQIGGGGTAHCVVDGYLIGPF